MSTIKMKGLKGLSSQSRGQMDKLLAELFASQSCTSTPITDPEIQYQMGLYWFGHDQIKKAEQWIRYAAKQGHTDAIRLLHKGQREGFFWSDESRFISLAIDLLETFVTPTPSQEEIDGVQHMLQRYVHKRYMSLHMVA